MELSMAQRAEQKQILSPVLRQSLHLLQMTLPELRDYVQEQTLSNPLLELDSPLGSDSADVGACCAQATPEGTDSQETFDAAPPAQEELAAEQVRLEHSMPDYTYASSEGDAIALAHAEDDFTDVLLDQLTRMRWLTDDLKRLCAYLIECLDENGYLRFDLAELAAEQHTEPAQMEQALFVVQSLEPAGTGARDLSECLILQLAQSRDFSALTVGIAQNGLSLLARNNILGLAKLLGCTRAEAQAAANAVRKLSPIPSRGYGNGRRTVYQVPEAVILREDGQLLIRLNRTFAPQPTLNKETETLLESCVDDPTAKTYLQEQSSQARQLIDGVASRTRTITRILELLVKQQQEYFLSGSALRPFTMSAAAAELGLSTSTVSRAVQGKSVLFDGKNIELRNLFSTSIDSGGTEFSSAGAKQQLLRLLQNENTARPYSDERLCQMLAESGFRISRRTVAKYRDELQVPAASLRRSHT